MADPTENLLDAFEIDFTILGSRYDRTNSLHNLSNIVRSKLRNPSAFPKARILMKNEKLIIYGVPRSELEATLDSIQANSLTNRYQPFEYNITPKQLSSGEVLDLTFSYISGLEKQVGERDAKISSLEKMNADLEKICREAGGKAEAAHGEVRLLKVKMEQARMEQAFAPARTLGAGTAHVTYVPKIKHENLVDILSAASSFVRLADQQIEFYARLSFNIDEKLSEPLKPAEYFEEKLGVKGETPADLVEKLTRKYETGWFSSFAAFRRASKEVLDAMNEYSKYLARYTLLSAFREAEVKIPVFSVSNGQAVHYYIPKGSNKGELSKSLRDSVMQAAVSFGAQAGTEKIENAYKISVPKDAAAAIEAGISQNPAGLWKNLGVQVYVVSLDSAEV